jgi:hypothetical protein
MSKKDMRNKISILKIKSGVFNGVAWEASLPWLSHHLSITHKHHDRSVLMARQECISNPFE